MRNAYPAALRPLPRGRGGGLPLESVHLRDRIHSLLDGRSTLSEFLAWFATAAATLDLSPPLARRVRLLVRQAERGEVDTDLLYSTLARVLLVAR